MVTIFGRCVDEAGGSLVARVAGWFVARLPGRVALRIVASGAGRPDASRLTRSVPFVACIAAAVMSAACAPMPESGPTRTPSGAPAVPGVAPLLTPWVMINGGWSGGPLLPPPLAGLPAMPQPLTRLALVLPVALTARGNDLYIADAGLRRVFRYDRGTDRLAPVHDLGSVGTGKAVSLDVSDNHTLYVAEATSGRVVAIAPGGRRTELLARGPGRPIGIAALPGGEFALADGNTNEIVRYSSFGRPVAVLGSGRGLRFLDVADMVRGPAGLYVLDRQALQVIVISTEGEIVSAIGLEGLGRPVSIAVDRMKRVFVVDQSDNTISAYVDGRPVARFGGAGAAPGRFNQPAGLAADENVLFVADTLNARVQTLLVAPDSLFRPPGAR